ncbi:WecB/TagA/CpsF family glycosyltransferase [Acaryochloris sp. IP29b_bin.148]|uniref:WecB/TagA/CpsF family glycosyltransferase n=1 Tax=Acaryochloris sp. IP29b_bin.148 TaxID=2969218 RepID=UPI00262097AE|nr:WecB/TagA/CpsF family glycosyltransferase [Acaryochloris sp. IP29b_bin.148]
MTENTLGQILIHNQLIDQNALNRALQKQKGFLNQSDWKLLGEILVESGDICHRDLWAALEWQSKVFDIELFTLHPHPSVRSRLKRLLDVLGAIIGITVMLIVLPLVATAILLDSRGSIFFTQYRVGLRGKQFRILKFRTMVRNAERTKLKTVGKQQYKFFNVRNDPRVTRVGKFLRKTHLDELPQFINVLRGEMSLVGTRPPTLDEVKVYSREDWQRLSIKPGMTGLWQTSRQKYSADFSRVVELDMSYVGQWQLGLDLKVIIYTILQVILGSRSGLYLSVSTSGHQDKVKILNLPIDNLTQRQFLQQLDQGVVFTANVDHLMKLQYDQEFCQAYSQADFRTCDSQILVYASQFLGQPIRERLSGSDLFPEFCRFHRDNENIKVFLLGGSKNVAKRAQTKINRQLGRNIIVGAHSPSFGVVENPQECLEIVDQINQHQPTVLAVCLGAPNQEKWICRYKDRLPTVKIFLAIGATIDFESGRQRRSPQWVSNLGFEWLHRLMSEPERLWKRYLIDDLPFFWLLIKQKMGLYSPRFPIHEQREYPFASPTLKKRT